MYPPGNSSMSVSLDAAPYANGTYFSYSLLNVERKYLKIKEVG
ncbi:hypothetical protein BSU04_01805 [Caballeronia sordidicola]|uniref:Uncharacterized protein n=1 Tax=Caballeronia sordidicola TaxID=196367 RepID=A0A226XBC4_CABSO|nr:hypothetical protein BSU04_01805 [Caballeronia sordidicola]